jgi:hypothetical protein
MWDIYLLKLDNSLLMHYVPADDVFKVRAVYSISIIFSKFGFRFILVILYTHCPIRFIVCYIYDVHKINVHRADLIWQSVSPYVLNLKPLDRLWWNLALALCHLRSYCEWCRLAQMGEIINGLIVLLFLFYFKWTKWRVLLAIIYFL